MKQMLKYIFSSDQYKNNIKCKVLYAVHIEITFAIISTVLCLQHISALDPITLAVFQDSGWYQVNISRADQLLWGRSKILLELILLLF